MLFNSYVFIFAFLPITVAVYFLLCRMRLSGLAKGWLTLSSLFFYGWWDMHYIPLILGSIGFNYAMGRLLMRKPRRSRSSRPDLPDYRQERGDSLRRVILAISIIGNVLLLFYYKYADFFLTNVNELAGTNIPLLDLVLPLGISFFTFTQIAFLVDAYRRKAREASIINYMLFVTFYPHLIAGPILHHSEMMPQFDRLRNKVWDVRNVSLGLYIFVIGLFKKVVIADTFAGYATNGFTGAEQFLAAWTAALSYTFQLYFDFSGYTDMAIGAALLFNIKLPQNFNSPYKATNLQDFWRRWHMTLSRWLRDYIYIPLGGNRKGEPRMLVNLMIVFLVGGLWHGAGWTFLFWGFLHGFGQVIHRVWSSLCKRAGVRLPVVIAWLITFLYVVIAWVFFRADSLDQAARILRGMFGQSGFDLNSQTVKQLFPALALIAFFFPIVLFTRSSYERMADFRPSWRIGLWIALLFIVSLLYFNQITEFLYFNF